MDKRAFAEAALSGCVVVLGVTLSEWFARTRDRGIRVREAVGRLGPAMASLQRILSRPVDPPPTSPDDWFDRNEGARDAYDRVYDLLAAIRNNATAPVRKAKTIRTEAHRLNAELQLALFQRSVDNVQPSADLLIVTQLWDATFRDSDEARKAFERYKERGLHPGW